MVLWLTELASLGLPVGTKSQVLHSIRRLRDVPYRLDPFFRGWRRYSPLGSMTALDIPFLRIRVGVSL